MKKMMCKIAPQSVLLILSGIMCGLIQGLFSLPCLAFICYSPMMYALVHAEGRFGFFKGFMLFFAPYYSVSLSFLLSVHRLIPASPLLTVPLMILTVALLTIWECLLMLIPVYPFLWLKRIKYADIFALALLITGGEWLQENIFVLSFPWSGVWLSVTGSPMLLQPANLLGSRFVSFIILSANGLIAELVMKPEKKAPAAFLVLLFAGVFSYGGYSLDRCKELSQNGVKLTALCVQDDAEGLKKNEMTPMEAALTYEKIAKSSPDADLVLLPETAVPCNYSSSAQEFEILRKLAAEKNCVIVTGCFLHDGKDYNSMLAITSEGASDPYCKQRLVPFGEKIPFALFTGADTLSECSDKRYLKPTEADGMKIGCAVCVESVYSSLVKQQTREGAQLICVSTNDSWFGKSFARYQHYRHCIMRAAENRKWLLRSGNCGISAIISPWGEETAVLEESCEGAVSGEISLIPEGSLYARTGDLFITLPAALCVLAVIRRYRQHSTASD